MPDAMIAFLILFFVNNFGQGAKDVAKELFESFWEILLLQQVTTGIGMINITWFLSAYLITIMFLYPILYRLRDVFCVIVAPICFALLISYAYGNWDNMACVRGYNGFVYDGIVRALIDFILGIIIYNIFSKINIRNRKERFVLTAFETLFGAVVVWYILRRGWSKNDFIILIIMSVFIGIVRVNESYFEIALRCFNVVFVEKIGQLSFYVYLGHALVLKMLKYLNSDGCLKWMIIYTLVILYAVVLRRLSKFVRNCCKRVYLYIIA